MKRSELKQIVKECLVEILAEGLGSQVGTVAEGRSLPNKKKANLAEERRLAEHRKKLETNVTNIVTGMTDDPVMQDILAHTAQTTLQEQLAAEPSGASSPLQTGGTSTGAGINLDTVFEGANKNWAEVAFSPKKIV